LFIGGSSTQFEHQPVGLTLVAFFTILIFMGRLLCCRTGRGMRQ
jgi:hypothetical protein